MTRKDIEHSDESHANGDSDYEAEQYKHNDEHSVHADAAFCFAWKTNSKYKPRVSSNYNYWYTHSTLSEVNQ